MNPTEWNDAVAASNKRISRLERVRSTLTTNEKAAVVKETQSYREALARQHPSLSADMVKYLSEELLMSPAFLGTVMGTVRELPADRAGWDSLARSTVAKDELAQANLIRANEKLRDQLSEQVLNEMYGPTKMAMARDGSLDAHIAGIVDQMISERAGL